jgi:hypothetical protein
MMWRAHIAARRVEIGVPPTYWAACARKRLNDVMAVELA